MDESADPDVMEAQRRRAEADELFEADLAKARSAMIVAEFERRDAETEKIKP